MPYTNKRRISGSARQRSRSRMPLNARLPLPKAIRNELRMCVALRGYSSIREGSGKTLKQQRQLLYDFFHGVTGKNPSQVRMLTEGKLHYADLYDTTTHRNVTSKKKKTTCSKVVLKQSLSKDETRLYYLGTDINVDDLEKKNRSGDTLLNGRQLVDMAKRGLRDYRKAMAFTSDKWNVKTNEPIESGTTVDDVVEYVRRRMYLSMNVITIDEEEEEDEKDNEAEKEILIEFMKNKRGKDDWTNKEDDKKKNNKDSSDIESDESDSTLDDSKSNKVMKEEDDDEYVDEKEGNDNKDNGNESKKGKNNEESDEYNTSDDDESKSENSTYVPDTFLFQSFFAYSLWGPFASMDKQLPLFLMGKYIHISISLSINYSLYSFIYNSNKIIP
jgi:hypothetical protein